MMMAIALSSLSGSVARADAESGEFSRAAGYPVRPMFAGALGRGGRLAHMTDLVLAALRP